MDKLLEVKNLKTYFYTSKGVVPAVDGVSFDINVGETLCIVGESGCGKSVTSQSILKLVATPPGKYVDGEIIFEGKNILDLDKKELMNIRGNEISMIFQEPMTALNPVHNIGRQIIEIITAHEDIKKQEAFDRAVEMLKLAGIPDPVRCAKSFPHELSGGMRQRAMIAMALACKPKMLIADEPTTALDVSIQAQILELIEDLKKETNMTVLMITHDLGVVADVADRVIVMYAGKVVEEGEVTEIFKNPLHPYTQGLLNCIPRLDCNEDRLCVIKGQVPNPLYFPEGCRFNTRCPFAKDICLSKMPEELDVNGRKILCHFRPEDRILNEGEDNCDGKTK